MTSGPAVENKIPKNPDIRPLIHDPEDGEAINVSPSRAMVKVLGRTKQQTHIG